MNKKINNLINIILKIIPILIIILILSSCATEATQSDDDDNNSSKNIVSTWSGSYVYDNTKDGVINTMKLYDDNTISGTWVASNSDFSLSLSGTYTLVGTSFTLSAAGTASSGSYTSNYTLTATGILGTTSGSGTYTANFTDPSWEDPYGTCTWSVTKL